MCTSIVRQWFYCMIFSRFWIVIKVVTNFSDTKLYWLVGNGLQGEVAVNNRVDVKSYTSLHKLVDDMFPAMPYTEQVHPTICLTVCILFSYPSLLVFPIMLLLNVSKRLNYRLW